ncbi:MAG: hypothetical protein JNK75_11855 [Betaproteobacteria bacterium]|nr:hypothetical protein [Betaproteobacteria bacterium]
MKKLLSFLLLAAALPFAPAWAQKESTYEFKKEDLERVKAMAAVLIGEFAAQCPVKAVDDKKAFEACRAAHFRPESAFRAHVKPFVLWGRPLGGDINAPVKEFRTTQFGPDVYSGTYLPMWMWDGTYDVDFVAKDGFFRITAGAGFRNELDFGQYPYPFWHEAKKWTDYEDANTMAIWISPKDFKIGQLTFYKRADKPAVAQLKRRHMPTFDGKWMWVDKDGREQPAPTLFLGLYSDKNPHLQELDKTYRTFALTMREAQCDTCHVPNNPDKMKRLVLLQTPLHAAAEIERSIKDVKRDRMPLDDSGNEKPLDEKMKAKFLTDGEAFAKAVKAAREWELANRTKVSAAGHVPVAAR